MSITVTENMKKAMNFFLSHNDFVKATIDTPDDITVKQIASKYDISNKNIVKFIFETKNGNLNICVLEDSLDDFSDELIIDSPEMAVNAMGNLPVDKARDITCFIDPETHTSVELCNNHSLIPFPNPSTSLEKLIILANSLPGVESAIAYELYENVADSIVLSCKIEGHTTETVSTELLYEIFTASENDKVFIEYKLTPEIYNNEELHESLIANLKSAIERL